MDNDKNLPFAVRSPTSCFYIGLENSDPADRNSIVMKGQYIS
jgi:hypothetical protein